MAESGNNYVATVGVQAVAEQGNLLAEFRQILENTSKTLAKEGGVTIKGDTSEATKEVKEFIESTKKLLEKGLGDINLGDIAKEFEKQMGAVQGEIKGISEQMEKLNTLMGKFGSGDFKNVSDMESRVNSMSKAVGQLQKDAKAQTDALKNQEMSEKELAEAYKENIKTARQYGAELDKLNAKKEESKAAASALSKQSEDKKIEALKQKWAEMQALQKNVESGGYTSDSGKFISYTEEGLKRVQNKLNETKKSIIDLQSSLKNVDFSKLGMTDITGEDDKLREAFKQYYAEIETKQNHYLAVAKEINSELEKRKAIVNNGGNSATQQFTEQEAEALRSIINAKEQENKAQTDLNTKIANAVAEYEKQKVIVDELITKQKQLSSMQDYKPPVYETKEEAQNALVQKAKEFNELLSNTPTITDTVHRQLQILANDMKSIASDDKWKTIVGKGINEHIDSPLDHIDTETRKAYIASMKYVTDASKLNDVNQKLADAIKAGKQAETIIRENATSVQAVTGKTVEQILGQAQAEEKVGHVAQQAGEQQVQAAQETTNKLLEMKRVFDSIYAETSMNKPSALGVNWAEDEIGSLDRIAERLKYLYTLRKEANFESSHGNEIVALMDVAKGAGFGNFVTDDGVQHLGKNVQTYFNNVKRFVEARKLLEEYALHGNEITETIPQAVNTSGLTNLETTATDLSAKLAEVQERLTQLGSTPSSASQSELENTRNTVSQLDQQIKNVIADLGTMRGDVAGSVNVEQFSVLENKLLSITNELETVKSKLVDPSTFTSNTEFQNVATQAGEAAERVAFLESEITRLKSELSSAQAKLVDPNTFATSEEFQKMSAEAESAKVKIAELQGQLTALRDTSTAVTGQVDVGNIVTVRGTAVSDQLALESTLQQTLAVQREIAWVLTEINTKMVDGATAATASYEQLKAVMTETVDAAKSLGAEEEKQAAKKKSNEKINYYKRLKDAMTEVINITKKLPKAGENESVILSKQLKAAQERVRYNQKVISQKQLHNKVEDETIQKMQKQLELQKAINKDKAVKKETQADQKLKTSYASTRKKLEGAFREEFIDTDEAKRISELANNFKMLDAVSERAQGNFGNLTKKEKAEIKLLIDQYNKLSEAQKKSLQNGQYFQNNKQGKYFGNITNEQKLMLTSTATTEQYQAGLKSVADTIASTTTKVENYNEATRTLTVSYRDADRSLQTMTVSMEENGNAARYAFKQPQEYVSQFSKLLDPFKNKIKELLIYFNSFMVLMRTIQFVKSGISTVKELNTVLTEFQLVTKNSSAEMAEFEKQAQEVAYNVASSTKEITASATDWARLGYDMEQSLELAAEAAKYAKVGFTDVDTATTALTSSLQAFYSKDISKGLINAGDAADQIVDKFVALGNAFPATSEGLGAGLQRSASALVAANNSIDESLAMITAGNAIVQDEQEVGNALKVLSMRLRNTTASELEEAGEDTEGLIEDASKLYETIKQLTAVGGKEGISIINTDTGEYKSTYEILLEISKVWDKLSDASQAKLVA